MALPDLLVFAGCLSACAFVAALTAVSARLRGRQPSALDEHGRGPARACAEQTWARALGSLEQPDVVLDRLLLHARQVLGAERVCLIGLDARTRQGAGSAVVAAVGPGVDQLGRCCVLDAGLAALALASTRPVLSPPHARPSTPGSSSPGPGWEAAARLAGRDGRPDRLLVAGWNEDSTAPGLAELDLLSQFAALAGHALEHQPDHAAAARESRRAIPALLDALGQTDGHTKRHSVQVAELATQVARRLGLGDADQLEVQLAALLHDVGKLRLPRALLRRRGPLSPAEWKLVRRHPQWGAEILASLPGLQAVASIVGLHHERPDGAGYPHQLPHARIPIESKIIAVCDAYTAMTSGRPYQPSLAPDDAIRELQRHAGTQFDGRTVAALENACNPRSPAAA